jgi:hypothetical protein
MTTEIYLAGGLGNQLFQLAAGLALVSDSELILKSCGDVSRTPIKESVDLSRLELAFNVKIIDKTNLESHSRRFANFALRVSTRKKNSSGLLKFRPFAIKLISRILSSLIKENFSKKGNRRYDTRKRYYTQFIMDDEKKIQAVYGKDFLPPESAPLEERAWAMGQAMKKFWTDFYLENKDLFSDKPY